LNSNKSFKGMIGDSILDYTLFMYWIR